MRYKTFLTSCNGMLLCERHEGSAGQTIFTQDLQNGPKNSLPALHCKRGNNSLDDHTFGYYKVADSIITHHFQDEHIKIR